MIKKPALTSLFLVLAVALPACNRQAPEGAAQEPSTTVHSPAQVDTKRLQQADQDAGNWMSHGRTYSEQRFSPLTGITADNASKLGLAWSYDLDSKRGIEATSLLIGNVSKHGMIRNSAKNAHRHEDCVVEKNQRKYNARLFWQPSH